MRFLAYDPDNCAEDDAHEIEALDAEDAAEEYANSSDRRSFEYTYARNGGTVMVRAKGFDEPWVRFEVSGRTVPVYHATRATDHPSNASGGHEPRQRREEPTDDAR